MASPGVETVPTVEFDTPSVEIVAPDGRQPHCRSSQPEVRLQREVATVRPHSVKPGLARATSGVERELARGARPGR